jgi:hypothetical protein
MAFSDNRTSEYCLVQLTCRPGFIKALTIKPDELQSSKRTAITGPENAMLSGDTVDSMSTPGRWGLEFAAIVPHDPETS